MKDMPTRLAVVLAALCLFAAIVGAQERPAQPGEDQGELTEAQTMAIDAYKKAKGLLDQGDMDGAVQALADTADKLGQEPEASRLRLLAVHWLAGRLLAEGIGGERTEKLLGELVAKASGPEAEHIYTTAASVYSVIGSYEAAKATARAYLEKFPPPTQEQLEEFREEALAAGKPAEPDPAQQHPRRQFRWLAQELLDKLDAIGKEPPHFELTTLEGETVSPGDFEGKVLLMDFWATWCPPCIKELPNVKGVYEKYHAKGFEILGLSADVDKDKLASFVKEQNMPWRQVYLGERREELADLYRVEGIPATFLVDRNGKLRALDLRGKRLEREVARLLQQEPAE